MSARALTSSFKNSLLVPFFDRMRDDTTFEAIKHLSKTVGEAKTVWFLVEILPFTLTQATAIVRAASLGDSIPFFNTSYSFSE